MARLIADIGGTNARFAFVQDDGAIVGERVLRSRDFPGLVEAAGTFLAGRRPQEAVLAVATPVEQDEIQFTNSPWRFSIRAARAALGLERLAVINDFVAQALAVPGLGPADKVLLGGGPPTPGRAIAVIGPGTGLGVAGLLPVGGRFLPVPSEGGHVSFAPADRLQAEILLCLQARLGHVSNERLISGPGLLQLARTLAEIRGEPLAAASPEDVTREATGGSALAAEAVGLFVDLLGDASGDLALAFGARGGVYVTGGICKRLGPLFDGARFRARFTAKGRMRSFLEPIPCWLVTRSGMGLLGAAAYDLGAGG
jgi:glucokinase